MHRFLSHAEFKYFSHGCMKNLTWRLEGEAVALVAGELLHLKCVVWLIGHHRVSGFAAVV